MDWVIVGEATMGGDFISFSLFCGAVVPRSWERLVRLPRRSLQTGQTGYSTVWGWQRNRVRGMDHRPVLLRN